MNDIKRTFLTPPDEFTPTPFWFLNDELDRDELKRQLLDFYEKGILPGCEIRKPNLRKSQISMQAALLGL